MTSLPDAVDRELGAHDAFEPTDNGEQYALTTTEFDAHVTATDAPEPRDGYVSVEVTLPTLDAAVADETVAPVVEDGWFETLERRLEDVFTVTQTDTHEEPQVERHDETVTVVLEFTAWDAANGVADAKALIEYVEGTYAQGIIPGYEYEGPAATLLESAQSRGQQAADGASGTEQGREDGQGNGNVPL
ncbi:uncharacterized protein Nmag_2260 [Natrialba magadii ATCC 43099]|uniref:Uncharacterized protein n=1 Tax=Natrialba magadii (strain ATCC 43099 / DSM 3394 / CCM 3739 / CIP 104546 / IAM 13178 / JCM 8861 / NBRC 102185 / NCIMB 2190 / MS3) TaxID=547559 RepID=D3SWU3_NATMM|nr:DUF5813 family protein [Natrialba magadii]ADD05825.1 uncharacterized protein Nmag_2260 [Natrialba magadii ATCC 43099]ELY30099.1 hypothetical protein C500_09104 [Natrialba magadii ATCC 43099]